MIIIQMFSAATTGSGAHIAHFKFNQKPNVEMVECKRRFWINCNFRLMVI